MSDLDIMIQEIARIALESEETRHHIGKELGITDSELDQVSSYLESLLIAEESHAIKQ